MYNKTVRQFTCRMSYDNEEHIKIMKVLDDLNTGVYKSVNRFIIEALKYYIDALGDEAMTNTVAEESKDFVTHKELDQVISRYDSKLKETKNEAKNSLFEEMFKMFTGTLIAGGTPYRQMVTGDHLPDAPAGIKEQESNEVSAAKENQGGVDVSEQLSHFDNVLSQVMSWGDEE